ncbi:GNAT family N-acetyltransferase [Caulobacter sp. S45]|uniref:GNAT family N-acetyltransferase n=1 Tax=Caulobacter sp. S45 TaxID=1641861 RepID=UPI0020C5DEA8|nr:N-acetyltransferase [Caulobacter sp. S45]
MRFACERPQDSAAVDALIDLAFGPGRFAKTAERLREGARAHSKMSVCAWMGDGLAGAVRLWPARLGGHQVVFLGPIAVEKTLRHRGLGAELVDQACARARAAGEQVVILVGDLGFFGPLGFQPVPAGLVVPPGPVDPRRLLWTAFSPGALKGMGGSLKAVRPA